MSLSPSQLHAPHLEGILEEDEIIGPTKTKAILTWLWNFPSISVAVGDENIFMNEWSENDTVISALHSTASEICSVPEASVSTIEGIEGYWKNIFEWVGITITQRKYEDCEAALCSLLCIAVAEDCVKRGVYIGRIMGLPKNIQTTLMQVIENGRENLNQANNTNASSPASSKSNSSPDGYLDDLDIDSDNESLLNDDHADFHSNAPSIDMINTSMNRLDVNKENRKSPSGLILSARKIVNAHTRSPLTPFRSPMSYNEASVNSNKLAPRQMSDSSFLIRKHHSPQTYNDETNELKEKNEKLSRDLQLIREEEAKMAARLDEMEAKHRSVRLKDESISLARENDMRQEYGDRIKSLEEELRASQESIREGISAKEDLAKLMDEIDVLQHSKEKLIQTEEQMRRLKSKMEQMGDTNEALERSEKAHSDEVLKNMKLENELDSLRPVRRQLEEYKNRAADSEIKLMEYQEDMKNIQETNSKLNDLTRELKTEALRHQIETDELRQQIEQTSDSLVKDANGIGDGISELNPMVKEELCRLRNENIRLKAFASKREDDSVQKMEEKLDDSARLGTKFKEQYFQTKKSLEDTQQKLEDSLDQTRVLQDQVLSLEKEKDGLKRQMKDAELCHKEALLAADRKLQATRKELNEEARKEKDVLQEQWEDKLSQEKYNSKKKLDEVTTEWKERESHLTQTLNKLREESAVTLQNYVKESMSKTEEKDVEHEEKIKELAEMHEAEKQRIMDEGKALFKKKTEETKKEIEEVQADLDDVRSTFTAELEDQRQKQKTQEDTLNAKVRDYKQKLKALQSQIRLLTDSNDALEDKCQSLERDRSNLRDENDRLRRQLGGRSGSDAQCQEYEQLQKEYNSILEENRLLKRQVTTGVSLQDTSFQESTDNDIMNESIECTYNGVVTTKATNSLSQLRLEYDERIDEIMDEKRELIMKHSAAVTDLQKAQRRARILENDVEKLKNEKTSLSLQLERSRHHIHTLDDPSPVQIGKRTTLKLSPGTLASRAAAWRNSKVNKMSISPRETSTPSPSSSLQNSVMNKSQEHSLSLDEISELKSSAIWEAPKANKKAPPLTIDTSPREASETLDLSTSAIWEAPKSTTSRKQVTPKNQDTYQQDYGPDKSLSPAIMNSRASNVWNSSNKPRRERKSFEESTPKETRGSPSDSTTPIVSMKSPIFQHSIEKVKSRFSLGGSRGSTRKQKTIVDATMPKGLEYEDENTNECAQS